MCIVSVRVSPLKKAERCSSPTTPSRVIAISPCHVNKPESPRRIAVPSLQLHPRAKKSSSTAPEKHTTQAVVRKLEAQQPLLTMIGNKSCSGESPLPSRRNSNESALRTQQPQSTAMGDEDPGGEFPLPSRHSSIRSALRTPSSASSRTSKTVRFALSPSDHSQEPFVPESFVPESSNVNRLTHMPYRYLLDKVKAAAAQVEPPTEASCHEGNNKWEFTSDVSSGIDNAELGRQTGFGGIGHLNRVSVHASEWNSMLDGNGFAELLPLKYDQNLPGLSSMAGDKVDGANKCFGNAPPARYERRVSAAVDESQPGPSQPYPRFSFQENDEEFGSATDYRVSAVRYSGPTYPFAEYVRPNGDWRPVDALDELDSILCSAGRQPDGRHQPNRRIRFSRYDDMIIDLEPNRMAFVDSWRRGVTPSFGDGSAEEQSGSGNVRMSRTDSKSRTRESKPAVSRRPSPKVYYNPRTGTFTYQDEQDGFKFITRARAAEVDAESPTDKGLRQREMTAEASRKRAVSEPTVSNDSNDSIEELVKSVPGGLKRWGSKEEKRARASQRLSAP